jgi:Tol biopolymer transport system component/C-terminal processing protease CtpA/Prc
MMIMTAQPLPQPFLRTPAVDPDGQRVAFVHAGDIWLVPINGGPAERITANPAYHNAPRFSPDGTALAFSSGRSGHGDVCVLPLNGGAVRQLTFHGAYCAVEDWTPDGAAIYFSSYREQFGAALYRVALGGGTPAPVYAEPLEQLGQLSASPDGAWLAFANTRSTWWRRGPTPFTPDEIWLGPSAPDYAALRPLAGPSAAAPYAGRNCWPLWAPDGRGVYYVSDRDGYENLWYQPLEGAAPQQITHFTDGRLFFPQIARRSGLIVFEREGRIWRCDPVSGAVAPIPISVRSDAKQTPVRVDTYTRGYSEFRLSPDGKKVAFVARGAIFADFADKETDRDLRQGPSFRITDTPARESQIAWSPDSRALVYVSDRHGEEELYRYDFANRTETRLTSDATPKSLPRISPDGAWIAYVRGHDAIWLQPLAGGAPRELCRGNFIFGADLAWSPDSRWLAFLGQDERFFSNVYVVALAEGVPRQISFLSNLDGGDLRWAPNGQFIIFTSEQYRYERQIVRVDLRPPAPIFREAEFEKLFERQEAVPNKAPEPAPEPAMEPEESTPPPDEPSPADAPSAPPAEPPSTAAAAELDPAPPAERTPAPQPTDEAIVFEGIERRLRFLTSIQMNAAAEAISPDSRDLLFLAVVAGKVNIWTLPLDEPRADQPPRQITASDSRKDFLQFTPDGRAFFFLEDGQISLRKFPSGSDLVRLATRAEVQVDFHAEKHQIFGEAWRLLRDSFYDATFRGLDWPAVRERFAPLVAGAQNTGELHTIINLMVGELRASHLGSSFSGWGNDDGYTGMLFDPEALRSGMLKVARLIADSPAARSVAAPRPGEYLIAVNGTPLTPEVSLDKLLERSVGRRTEFTLAATPEGAGARTIALRPIDDDAYAYLRYRDWVLGNERYVHRVSAGRLGYVHIQQMSYPAYQQFLADLDAETHGKDGVIVDVRYNRGGHTATFILDVLARRAALLSGFRERSAMDASHLAGNRVLNKPTVLVTNERSASNTEMFSESYRRLGLGRVVGQPTAGAVIWTWSARLLDGATLALPRLYVITPEGEDLEGTGRPVDVAVARPLGEWALDRDSQLDAAVRTLMERPLPDA